MNEVRHPRSAQEKSTLQLFLAGLSVLIGASACSEREVLVPAMGIGGAPDSGPRAEVDCSADDSFEFLPIEDFELGAASVAYTNNEVCFDCTRLAQEKLGGASGAAPQDSSDSCLAECVASQFPTDLNKPLPAELIPEGRCDSRYALHLSGGPFYEWGGILAFPFAPVIDARAWDGVAFWARVRSGTRTELRVAVSHPDTDPTFVDPNTGEPRCAESTTIDEYSEGCDPFGAFVNLTLDWQLFLVPFDEMRQRGFGHTASALDLGSLRRVAFEYGQGSWDVWIDDVSLYREGVRR